MSKKTAHSFLEQLGKVLNLPNVDFDLDGTITITLENSYDIIIEYVQELNAIVVNAALGELPHNERGNELMREMLCANYMWKDTAGAHFAIDEITNLVCLNTMYTLPTQVVEQELGAFAESVIAIVNISSYWCEKIHNTAKYNQLGTGSMIRV